MPWGKGWTWGWCPSSLLEGSWEAASFSAGLEGTLCLLVAKPGNACVLPLGPWEAATPCARAHSLSSENYPPHLRPVLYSTFQLWWPSDEPISQRPQALQRPQGWQSTDQVCRTSPLECCSQFRWLSGLSDALGEASKSRISGVFEAVHDLLIADFREQILVVSWVELVKVAPPSWEETINLSKSCRLRSLGFWGARGWNYFGGPLRSRIQKFSVSLILFFTCLVLCFSKIKIAFKLHT